MKLSIVIPIYNASKYLKKCLDSVAKSPITDMECIMVNDGSTDSSEVICKAYADADRRFVYLQKENAGVSAARNSGLGHTRGKYVMFLDADDFLTEDAWALIDATLNQEMADYTAFAYYSYYEDGRTELERYQIEGEKTTDFEAAKKLVYASSQMNTCWGKIFDYDIIRNNKIKFQVDLPIGEDYLFVAEYFQYCKTSYITNDPILYYLQRPGSAMRSYSMAQRIGFMEILYRYNLSKVEELQDVQLKKDFYNYYLRVVTNLFLVFAKEKEEKELKELYQDALHHEVLDEIFKNVTRRELSPFFKKIEYDLLKRHHVWLLTKYFGLKKKM